MNRHQAAMRIREAKMRLNRCAGSKCDVGEEEQPVIFTCYGQALATGWFRIPGGTWFCPKCAPFSRDMTA